MTEKKISAIIVFIFFVAGIFLLGVFGASGVFEEGSFYSPIKTKIDIEGVRGEMKNMSVEEIEEVILEIQEEIKRLQSQSR